MLQMSLILAIMSSIAFNDSDSIDKKLFLEEYRQSLGRLTKLYSQVQMNGQLTVATENQKSGQSSSHSEFKYMAVADNTVLYDVDKNSGKNSDKYYEIAIVVKPDRPFAVRRNEENGPYVLDALDKMASSYLTHVKQTKNRYIFAPISAGGILLDPMVNSDKFTIEKIQTDGDSGAKLVRIEFSYKPNDKHQFDLSGWLLIDPSLDYRLKKYQIRKTSQANPAAASEVSGDVSYKQAYGKVLTEDVSMTSYNASGKSSEFCSLHVDKLSFDPPPSTVFSLGAFGLGDLDFPLNSKPIPTSFYFFGVAIAALTATITFRFWMNRQSRRGASHAAQ